MKCRWWNQSLYCFESNHPWIGNKVQQAYKIIIAHELDSKWRPVALNTLEFCQFLIWYEYAFVFGDKLTNTPKWKESEISIKRKNSICFIFNLQLFVASSKYYNYIIYFCLYPLHAVWFKFSLQKGIFLA